MKTTAITLVIIGALLSAMPAGAQETGQTSFTLVGHDDAGFYWTLEGQSAKNPDLVVPAGATITITLKSAGGFHNVKVGSAAGSEYVDTGEEKTYTFTAPESGTVAYVCEPHKGSGMVGTVRVAGSDPAPTDGGKGTPGLGLVGAVVALAGVALYMRRK